MASFDTQRATVVLHRRSFFRPPVLTEIPFDDIASVTVHRDSEEITIYCVSLVHRSGKLTHLTPTWSVDWLSCADQAQRISELLSAQGRPVPYTVPFRHMPLKAFNHHTTFMSIYFILFGLLWVSFIGRGLFLEYQRLQLLQHQGRPVQAIVTGFSLGDSVNYVSYQFTVYVQDDPQQVNVRSTVPHSTTFSPNQTISARYLAADPHTATIEGVFAPPDTTTLIMFGLGLLVILIAIGVLINQCKNYLKWRKLRRQHSSRSPPHQALS